MKLYLNLKNTWKIYILVFILSSCSDIGGIVEIAVKDGVKRPLDSKEIIQSVDNTNTATSYEEKITQNNSITTIYNSGPLANYSYNAITEEKFVSFDAANSDGLRHFHTLNSGIIGQKDPVSIDVQDSDGLLLGFDFQFAAF